MIKSVESRELRNWIVDGSELALIDLREEGEFSAEGHLLFAICLPISQLEIRIRELVPRKSVRLVLCDGGDTITQIAAERLVQWGYSNIFILSGGSKGWETSGNVLFRGVNVPSKAFGEYVEHHSGTPSVSPEELKMLLERGEDLIVLDSRPWVEYQRMNIPTGVDCPGAELAYRIYDLVDNDQTTIVVNCAGRTRSIIGAQSLINFGVENKVVALRNGTMGWALAGFDLEQGGDRKFPPISEKCLEAGLSRIDNVVTRFGVQSIDQNIVEELIRKSEEISLFLLDVRNVEEYEAGHFPGSVHAPGGQLVQATDRWVGVKEATLILFDDTGIRAKMTASWLIQMGWRNIFVMSDVTALDNLEKGPAMSILVQPSAEVAGLSVDQVKSAIDQRAVVLDFSSSLDYKAAHIPGAFWAVRSRLKECLAAIPDTHQIICACTDGVLSAYAAADLLELTDKTVSRLIGGNAAWLASERPMETGFQNLTTLNNDIQYKAYDFDENIQEHMQEYLSWEIGLIDLIKADGTSRFVNLPEESH